MGRWGGTRGPLRAVSAVNPSIESSRSRSIHRDRAHAVSDAIAAERMNAICEAHLVPVNTVF